VGVSQIKSFRGTEQKQAFLSQGRNGDSTKGFGYKRAMVSQCLALYAVGSFRIFNTVQLLPEIKYL
jgi:hypothetical protein